LEGASVFTAGISLKKLKYLPIKRGSKGIFAHRKYFGKEWSR